MKDKSYTYETKDLYQILELIDDGILEPTPKGKRILSEYTDFDVLSRGIPESTVLLKNVETLRMFGAYTGDFSGLRNFPKTKHIKCNRVFNRGNYELAEQRLMELFQALSSMQHLEDIDLSYNEIRNLQGFPILPSLVKLNISNNILEELSALSGLHLQTLDISGNHSLKSIIFDGMETLKSLEMSNVNGDKMTKEIVRIHGLEHLDLSNSWVYNLEFLKDLPCLKHLSITVQEFLSKGSFRTCRELETLNIGLRAGLEDVESLLDLPNLRELTIQFHNFTNMDMLKKLRGIQLDRLTLYGKFTDKDKEYLMHMPNIGEICIKK